MTKATHKGTCQICGNLQKLPGGYLSIHGYTVTWGFFNGVCNGTGNLPFEVSKDMIDRAIANAIEQRDGLMKQSAEWKAGKQLEGNLAWGYVYHKGSGFGRNRIPSRHTWEHVELACEVRQYESGTYLSFSKKAKNETSWEKIYSTAESIDAMRMRMNIEYAERHLDKMVAELNRYIKWQEGRIKDWKPTDLTPV